ncbi:heterokaryon incompatibility protein-domain-containing protein [Cadophora sp. MPI-SDFR-AT-0126]|nr:heterokaryon incompatibility protein-domain-containing protein [Leotiomycetes sp. MPI-SDFR-AT-0126]
MEYQYSPLGTNQFRLLTLHPGASDAQRASQAESPISCTLRPYRRDQSPPYCALSYTWGDAIIKVPILVNDSTLHVTTNLFTALKHIREDNSPVTLWIDAICINQEDDEEKSSQVKMMREIYDNAEHTRSWLGPAEDGTDAAMAELDRVGSYIIQSGLIEPMKEFFRLSPTEVERYKVLESKIKEGLAPLVVQAVENTSQTFAFIQNACGVLSRSYWKRVWILQELIVSPQIIFQCGKSTIEFPKLYASVCYMHLLGTQIITRELERIGGLKNLDAESTATFNFAISLSTQTDRMSNSTKLFGARLRYQGDAAAVTSEASQYSKLGSSMFELLARIHVSGATKTFCGATNPRDRIFALLGIANDRARLGIEPEYDQSKTCSEIYTHGARAIIQSGQVDLLALSQPQGRETDMPSWAPDWRAEWILRPSGQLPWDSAFNAFSVTTESLDLSTLKVSLESSPDQIRFRGYTVDVIEEVGREWTPPYLEGYSGESDASLISAYLTDITNFCTRSEEKITESQKNIYANHSDRISAPKRIPVADQEEYGTGFIRRAGKDSDEGYDHVKQHSMIVMANDAAGITPEQVQHFTHPLRASYSNMMNWQRDRRPFLSDKGYAGLAPLHAQAGDVIVVFENAKFPYVLRDNGNGTCTFVGEAYVHGIMYGEYVEGKTAGDALMTFILV